jgi:hypothetical protein
LSAAKLAGVVGLKGHANVSMAVKRYGAALGKDRAELAFARKAAELLHVTL